MERWLISMESLFTLCRPERIPRMSTQPKIRSSTHWLSTMAQNRSRSSHSSTLMVPVKYQVTITSIMMRTSTAGISRTTRWRASEPRGTSRSRRLRTLEKCFIRFEQIAETAHGLDRGTRPFKTAPQTVNVDFYCVLAEVGIPGGKRIHDLLLGDHPPCTQHEHFEDGQFTHGKIEPFAPHPDLAPDCVELQGPCFHNGLGLPRPAARQRAHPGGQLDQLERLGDVIVGATVQTGHAVSHAVARSENQHGQCLPRCAQLTQGFQTAFAGQIEIEQKKVVVLAVEGLHDLAAFLQPIDGIALLAEKFAQGIAQSGVVFNHEYSHIRDSSRAPRPPEAGSGRPQTSAPYCAAGAGTEPGRVTKPMRFRPA